MLTADKLLVVVHIYQGQKFPRKPKHKIIVYTKFDGEELETDPVDHIESPDFSTELAWKIDKKSLHLHKLQRTPLKLQIFDIDLSTGRKEAMGYIMLDLRMAQAKSPSRWMSLLSSRYVNIRPELQIGMYIDVEEGDNPHVLPNTHIPKQPMKKNDNLAPVIHDEEGYVQIGSENTCTSMFLLSLTVSHATNLTHIIPSDFSLPRDVGFHFSYAILGHPVTNETFNDLISADFTPERSTVKVRSNLKSLRIYLSNLDPLPLSLYCGTMELGEALVPISKLLKDFVSVGATPIKLETTCALNPIRQPKQKILDSAAVGVVIELKRETTYDVVGHVDNPKPPFVLPSPIPVEEPTSKHKQKYRKGGKPRRMEKPVVKVKVRKEDCDRHLPLIEDLVSEAGVPSLKDDTKPKVKENMQTVSKHEGIQAAFAQLEYPPIAATHVDLTESSHHYCFSLNLDCLDEISTELNGHFIFIRNVNNVEDSLLCVAWLPLSKVFTASPSYIQPTGGRREGYKQTINIKVPFFASNGGTSKVCRLSATFSLSDHGVIIDSSGRQGVVHSPPIKDVPMKNRETEEYKFALELEMWKEGQERQFEKLLKDKELHHMKTLAEQWKKRDTEREMLMKKKITEYTNLQEQLKTSLCDVEKREALLSKNEISLNRLKEDFKREHCRKLEEMKEVAARLEQDCRHQVDMEKAKSRQLQDEVHRLKLQESDSEKRLQQRDAELQQFREQHASRPEVRLQTEMSMLRLERAELERKLDANLKSKTYYKTQCGRALREMARLKQREQKEMRARIKEQENELDDMKSRTDGAVSARSEEIHDLRKEIDNLMMMRSGDNTHQKDGYLKNDNDVADAHIARLMEERDSLLKTGVYSNSDKIISELNQHIKDAFSNKHSK